MMTPDIGSISEGTLDPRDLVEVFADEYRRLVGASSIYNPDLYDRAYAWVDRPHAEGDTEGDNLVDELTDHLQDLAPDFTYFGANPDDGASFGFWPDIDAVERSVRDGETLRVSDMSEIGHVALVNDHGNVTLYTVTLTEV